jgi:hypothetical protein
MCEYSAPLTGTQPLASRGPNSSGAMYRGVPRGGVLTAPHPRPVGSGMARKARPKSLIFADMETEPPASTELTHRTCLQGWGKGRQLPPSEWNNHTGTGCTNEWGMQSTRAGHTHSGPYTRCLASGLHGCSPGRAETPCPLRRHRQWTPAGDWFPGTGPWNEPWPTG